jgi:hypothetical protein
VSRQSLFGFLEKTLPLPAKLTMSFATRRQSKLCTNAYVSAAQILTVTVVSSGRAFDHSTCLPLYNQRDSRYHAAVARSWSSGGRFALKTSREQADDGEHAQDCTVASRILSVFKQLDRFFHREISSLPFPTSHRTG